jgi:hypothetical protein
VNWRWLAVFLTLAIAAMVGNAGGLSASWRQLSNGLREMAPVSLAVGVLALLHAHRLRRQAQRAAQWPTCPGIITKSSVDSRKRVSVSTSIGRGTPPKRRHYRQAITYSYDVAGTRHEGHRLRFGDGSWDMDRSVIERLISSYPLGASVEVSYDPNAPGESVLNLTPMPVARQAFVFALACFALCAFGWLQR